MHVNFEGWILTRFIIISEVHKVIRIDISVLFIMLEKL